MTTNLKKLSVLLATSAALGLGASFAQAADNPCIVPSVVFENPSMTSRVRELVRVVDFENDVVVYRTPSYEGGVAIKSFKELSERVQKKLEEQRKTLPKQCQ